MLQVQGLGGLRHVLQDFCSCRPCGDVQLGAAVPAGGGAQQTHAQQRAIQRHWALRVDDARDGGSRSILSRSGSKCRCDCARGRYHVRVSGMRSLTQAASTVMAVGVRVGWTSPEEGAVKQTACSVSVSPVSCAGARLVCEPPLSLCSTPRLSSPLMHVVCCCAGCTTF